MPSRRVRWHWSAFDSLSPRALHPALALRAAAFVVEQRCVFLDPDDYDADGWHLLGWSGGGPSDGLIEILRRPDAGSNASPRVAC